MNTSSRISLSFTLFSTIALLIFGIIINVFFLINRYSVENRQLKTIIPPPQGTNQKVAKKKKIEKIRDRFTKTIEINISSPKAKQIEEKAVFRNLSHIEDERVLRKRSGNTLRISRVTPFMKRQLHLLYISLASLSIFALLCYLFSKNFVRRNLRDLKKVADHVKSLHIDKLHIDLNLDHLPEDDLIHIVNHEISSMQKTITSQVDEIKRFVDNISHEIKTPLMIMKSSNELAILNKEYKKALDTNSTQITSLQTLLDTLLNLSQTQSNKNVYISEPTPYSLHEFTSQITNNLKSIYQKNQDITIDINADLYTQTHKGALQIILKNLIQNAIKYTPPGGDIFISAYIDNNSELTIHISDSGPGISDTDIQKIREPFWQGDASKGDDSGFGLGLSLVRQLVQRLGGKISAKNKTGEIGLEVSVWL